MGLNIFIVALTICALGCSSGGGAGSASTSASATNSLKKVFVTSTTYNGGFALTNSADTNCAIRAAAAGLSGTWYAYLSYNGITLPYAGFTGSGPWYKMDGTTLIASNLADLTDGSIGSPINQDEFGNSVSALSTVFIGMNTTQHCTGWTSIASTASAHTGLVGASTSLWSNSGTTNCGSSARLYCFQQ